MADTGNDRIQKFSPKGKNNTWGNSGKDQRQFSFPSGIATDSSGNIYVADTGNDRIQKFSPDGIYDLEWGDLGSTPGKFSGPSGIAIDTSGNVYVADTNNNRIQKFSNDGQLVKLWELSRNISKTYSEPISLIVDRSGDVYVTDIKYNRIEKFSKDGKFKGSFGNLGKKIGEFNSPRGIALDKLGNMYVADTDNNRIQKFRIISLDFINMKHPFTRPESNQTKINNQKVYFKSPEGISLDKIAIYVTDTDNNRIQKFSKDGTFITKWGKKGSAAGEFSSPSDIATDTTGNIYVTDTGNNRIQKFTSFGTFIKMWPEKGQKKGEFCGQKEGEFCRPSGIATDTSDNVYVADTGNNRIQKFTSELKYLLPIGEFGYGKDKFNLPVDIDIDSKDNIFVADKGNNRIQKVVGTSVMEWLKEYPFDSPSGIALDVKDNLYVSDTNNHKIYRFNSNGKLDSNCECSFGGFGLNAQNLYFPTGIDIDDDTGDVYVADTGNNVIKKFIMRRNASTLDIPILFFSFT